MPGSGALQRTPGPVGALPLEPCRTTCWTEPVLKIRAVDLIVIVANGGRVHRGSSTCRSTSQGVVRPKSGLGVLDRVLGVLHVVVGVIIVV